jgi:hypothetical protein
MTDLVSRIDSCLKNRLQQRTLKGYTRLVQRYQECCDNYRIRAFPPSEHSLEIWMAYLTATCSAKSIANYLSAIGDFCKLNGFDYNTPRLSFRIKSILNGIHILYPHVTVRKNPITITHLHRIYNTMDPHNLEHATFWAMASCAFFGLMRLGELTLHEDNRRTLKKNHIQNINSKGLTIYLPASKTDSHWNGNHIFIPVLPSILCPVQALTKMLSLRRDNDDSLFIDSELNILTRQRFLSLLRQFLPEADISGHSFRAGGATWAAELGLSQLEICRLGRWSSEAFAKYLRAHPLLQFMLRMDPFTSTMALTRYNEIQTPPQSI